MTVKIGPIERQGKHRTYTYRFDALITHAIWEYWRLYSTGPTVHDIARLVPSANTQTIYNAVRRMHQLGEIIYDEESKKAIPVELVSQIRSVVTRGYQKQYGDGD